MIFVGTAAQSEDLATLKKAGAVELLLGCAALSRYGTFAAEDMPRLAAEARRLGLKPVLEWDILMTQPEFEKAAAVFDSISLGDFSAVRVQDPGAFEWILSRQPAVKLQLVLETGNHNLEAVLSWCRCGGSQLERVILSSQLPAATLREWTAKIPVETEVLGLGPVLILYTPRHLLTNQLPEKAAAEQLRAIASSDESFHAGFRALENKHGTFVFLGKDYCLMDLIEDVSTLGLTALRIDLRLNEKAEALSEMAGLFSVTTNAEAAAILKKYTVETTRCFYKTNQTDKAFVRLKNENLTRLDDGYVGEIVEAAKDSHLIVHVRARGKSIHSGQKLRVINPHGEEKTITIQSLQTIDLKEADCIDTGGFGVIPYHRDLPAKSVVYALG